MKTIIAFFLAVFFTSASFAQDSTQQQTQPITLADTTSGWQLIFSNPHYKIGHLRYFPPDTVYATASADGNLFLMRSFDKGLTWDTLPNPIPLGYLYFTSSMIGYSSGASSTVWKTTDGAKSWVAHDKNSVSGGPIVFANADTGIVFGSTSMARTTKAGETWIEINPALGANMEAGAFGSSLVGYGVGDTYSPTPDKLNIGSCQKTTDGGATWQPVYTGLANVYLYCCTALNDQTLIVGGTLGAIGKTTDGGNTWDSIVTGDQNRLYRTISFADSLHGMIAGASSTSSGIVLSTIDAGKTWTPQYLPNPPQFTSVTILNDSIALVCGSGNIYRTTVGGNFSSVSQQHTIDFQVQTFPNPTSGSISIQYQLPSAQSVSFAFYNVQGMTVGNINAGMQDVGTHLVSFDGSSLSSGAYYFRLTTPVDFYTGSFTIQK